MQKIYFKTFGCRTNLFDTQVMMNCIYDYTITNDETLANIIIINSCTVTNNADSTIKSYINHIKKLPLNPRVVYTGCGVWTKGKKLFDDHNIDALFGHSQKEGINKLLQNNERFFDMGNLEHIDKTIVTNMIGKSRAFIKIQEGCDFACSYCIIPSVRGKARSYNEQHILDQISTLASNGFNEFVLTGTNVGSFGKGITNKDGLVQLIKKISLISGVKRIRLGSIEPIQITDEFKEILNEPWMGKYLHIALQHTSPQMLQTMNRRNTVPKDLKLFEMLSSCGYALGTDFIVGHPFETDEIWQEAMENMAHFPLTHIHQFTYSRKDNTPSAMMKNQVHPSTSKLRAKELLGIIEIKNRSFREKIKPLKILIETKKENIFVGYDQFFNKIHINSKENLLGKWINIKHYDTKGDINVAKL